MSAPATTVRRRRVATIVVGLAATGVFAAGTVGTLASADSTGTPEAGKSKTVVVPEYPLIPKIDCGCLLDPRLKPNQATLHTIPLQPALFPK